MVDFNVRMVLHALPLGCMVLAMLGMATAQRCTLCADRSTPKSTGRVVDQDDDGSPLTCGYYAREAQRMNEGGFSTTLDVSCDDLHLGGYYFCECPTLPVLVEPVCPYCVGEAYPSSSRADKTALTIEGEAISCGEFLGLPLNINITNNITDDFEITCRGVQTATALSCGCPERPPDIKCHLCADGSPLKPEFRDVVAFTAPEGTQITCGEVYTFLASSEECPQDDVNYYVLGHLACGCPAPIETPECTLCADSSLIADRSLDDVVVFVDNATGEVVTCFQFALFASTTLKDTCATVQLAGFYRCGCLTPPEPECTLCSDGSLFGDPALVNKTVSFGEEQFRCGDLSLIAAGFPAGPICLGVQTTAGQQCGCPSNNVTTTGCTLCFDGSSSGGSQFDDIVVSVEDDGSNVTCRDLALSTGFLDNSTCPLFQLTGFLLCGCPTAPDGFGGNCTLCADGTFSGGSEFDNVVVSSEDGQNVTCGQLAIFSALLDDLTCPSVQVTGNLLCGCKTAPEPVGDCTLCPDGSLTGDSTFDDVVVFSDPTGQSITCGQLSQFAGFAPEEDCPGIHFLGINSCGCSGTFDEAVCTLCANGIFSGGSIFDTKVVSTNEETLEETTCFDLALGAPTVPNKYCLALQATGKSQCGCEAEPSIGCSLCPNSTIFGESAFDDKVVVYDGRSYTCLELAFRASELPENACAAVQEIGYLNCGCDKPPCTLCADGSFSGPSSFDNVPVPGQSFTCLELAISTPTQADSACQTIQGWGFLHCGCPTAPCTICADGSYKGAAKFDDVVVTTDARTGQNTTCLDLANTAPFYPIDKCVDLHYLGSVLCGCPTQPEASCTMCADGRFIADASFNEVVVASDPLTNSVTRCKDIAVYASSSPFATEAACPGLQLTGAYLCGCPSYPKLACPLCFDGTIPIASLGNGIGQTDPGTGNEIKCVDLQSTLATKSDSMLCETGATLGYQQLGANHCNCSAPPIPCPICADRSPMPIPDFEVLPPKTCLNISRDFEFARGEQCEMFQSTIGIGCGCSISSIPSNVTSRVCRLCEDIQSPIIPNKVILYGGEGGVGQYCVFAEYLHNTQDNVFDSCSAFQEAHSSECCVAPSSSPSSIPSTSPTTSLPPTARPTLTPSAKPVVARSISGGKPQSRLYKGLAFVILGSLVGLVV